jgi:hypothetical protein
LHTAWTLRRSAVRVSNRYVLLNGDRVVTAAADLPWVFLMMVWHCAPAECKALLMPDGSSGGEASHLTRLLHKALEHAAGLLQQTAAREKYVSAAG